MGKQKFFLGLFLICFSLPAKAQGTHQDGLILRISRFLTGEPGHPRYEVDSTLKRVPVARLQELKNQKRMGAFKPEEFGDGWEDAYGIVWGKPGEQAMTHQRAKDYCENMGASLPSREQVARLLLLLESKDTELSKIFPKEKDFWTEDRETRFGLYPENLLRVSPGQAAMYPVNNDPPELTANFAFHSRVPVKFIDVLEREEKKFPAICVASYWTGTVY